MIIKLVYWGSKEVVPGSTAGDRSGGPAWQLFKRTAPAAGLTDRLKNSDTKNRTKNTDI